MDKPFALLTHRMVFVALSLLLTGGAAVGVFASQDAGGSLNGSSSFSNGPEAHDGEGGCVKHPRTPKPTNTRKPTRTPNGTHTPKATRTPRPTCTPAATRTATRTATVTNTPTATTTPRTATPTRTITPTSTPCVDRDDDDEDDRGKDDHEDNRGNDTHLDDDTDDGVDDNDAHLDKDREDCANHDGIHGIPDHNPSHEPNDDRACEKGETEIRTRPSGTRVNVPCHAAYAGESGSGAWIRQALAVAKAIAALMAT
jgi:hypothetical protein